MNNNLNQKRLNVNSPNKGLIHSASFELLRTGSLSHKEFIVFQFLINHLSNEGIVYVSIDNIAQNCKISKSTAHAAIKKLEELKIIEIIQIKKPTGNRKMNVYFINYSVLTDLYANMSKNDEYIDHQTFYEKVKFETMKVKKIKEFEENTSQSLENQTEQTETIENKGREGNFEGITEHNLYNTDIAKDNVYNITKRSFADDGYQEKNQKDEFLGREAKDKRDEVLDETGGKPESNSNSLSTTGSFREEAGKLKTNCTSKSNKETNAKRYSREFRTKKSENFKDFRVAEEEDYGRKVTGRVKWKLLKYREFYSKYLEEKNYRRLNIDEVLFFLVNTERLVDAGYSFNSILKTISYADKSEKIYNPIGWLIDRFQITKGRFYFLLRRKFEKPQEEKVSYTDRERREEEDKIQRILERWKLTAKAFGIPEEEVIVEYDESIPEYEYNWILQKQFAGAYWKRASKERKQYFIEDATDLAKYCNEFKDMTEEEKKRKIKMNIVFLIGQYAERVRMGYRTTLERNLDWKVEELYQ